MANDVEIRVTADTSNAEGGFKKVKSGFQGMKDSIVKNRKAIGLGITAMGVGIEGLAKSQQGLTESSRKLANATGMSEEKIRGMATSLSNATFPLDEALGLMTLGAQQGLESADALKQYAAFWDTVGDATGLSSEALAKAGAALAAVGVEVGDESELLGAFGLITQESTSTVQEFLDGIGKMAPELADMGVSVDEAAVIMTAMEREMGLTARTARTEFKEALEQSETGLAGVLEELGLSEDQLATYRTKLEESTGVIQANADAHASTKTVMDKLKSSFSDLVFANGAMIEKASMLAPIFMAAGPIVAGFSGIMGILTPVLHGSKVAFMGLSLSMGPITLIVLGIAAAIAAGILIWKNFDTIVAALKLTFEKITAIYKSKLGWLLPAGPLIKGIMFLAKNWQEIWDGIKDGFQKAGTFIKGLYTSKFGWLLPAGPLIKAILFLKDNWQEVWDSIKATFNTVTGALIGAFRIVKTTILGIWDELVSGIRGAVNTIIGGINTVIRGFNKFKIAFPGVKKLGVTIIPAFTIGMPQIPEIPTMAKGGIVNRPTLAMLGESGPEAVVPLGRGGGAGMTVNLVINGDINGMDDFEQKVTSVIRDAVLGGGFSGVLARA
jgi:phage-related protein